MEPWEQTLSWWRWVNYWITGRICLSSHKAKTACWEVGRRKLDLLKYWYNKKKIIPSWCNSSPNTTALTNITDGHLNRLGDGNSTYSSIGIIRGKIIPSWCNSSPNTTALTNTDGHLNPLALIHHFSSSYPRQSLRSQSEPLSRYPLLSLASPESPQKHHLGRRSRQTPVHFSSQMHL